MQVQVLPVLLEIEMAKKLRPCPKCRSNDIGMWDNGYSSFNVGGVKCRKCKFKVEISPCGCFPEDELIRAWNTYKPTVGERLALANRKIRKLQRELRKLKGITNG